jgi:hypothetical protein
MAIPLSLRTLHLYAENWRALRTVGDAMGRESGRKATGTLNPARAEGGRSRTMTLLGAGSALVFVGGWLIVATSYRTPAAPSHREPHSVKSTDRVLRFSVVGDLGDGGRKQLRVATRMCRWRREHAYRDVITTGDNIYPDGSSKYFVKRFFRPYACLLRAGVRFHASLGNHDYETDKGDPELAEPAFGIKGRNYVFRRRGVRFLIADSNALDVAWLRERLRTTAEDRWTIVAFHHPVYSPGPHGPTPGFGSRLARLFSRRGVDLVLNGHDHLYSVSRPVKGVRYVVTGGGGRELDTCERKGVAATCKSRNHFLYVVAGRRRIRVQAVPMNGAPFHRFQTAGKA